MLTQKKQRCPCVKFILTGLVLFFMFNFTGCSARLHSLGSFSAVPGQAETGVAPELLMEDLAFMIKTLEDVHPDLYAQVSADTIALHRKHIASQLSDSLSAVDFYRLIAPLAARFKDGHTGVFVPNSAFNAYLSDGGKFFPFDVRYAEYDGITAAFSYTDSSDTLHGIRILKINGLCADSLFKALRNGISGERTAFRNSMTAAQFKSLLWAYDIRPPFTIHYQKKRQDSVRFFMTAGVTVEAFRNIYDLKRNTRTVRGPYNYARLKENIAYIDFRSMVDSKQFDSFLKETFTSIKEHEPAGLIIDLRHNGGGDSRLGNQLVSYLTDAPYVMSGGKIWRMSGQYKKYVRERLSPLIRWVTYPPAIWLIRLFRSEAKMFTTKNGDTFTLAFSPVSPGKNPLRYHGKVCFLVGSGTYSSAMLLADAVKHNEIAALIGEETGGIPSHFGEIYVFDLPNSMLGVIVSTAKFIRADGDADSKNGVLPHIFVKSGLNPDEGDTVLEAAKEWILKTGVHDSAEYAAES